MASSAQAGDASHGEAKAIRRVATEPHVNVGLVLDVLRQQQQLNEDDIVFIGGSVADGLATPWSDVDVFVVRDGPQAVGDGLHLVPMPQDEIRMDLEIWPLPEVEILLDKLSGIQAQAASDHRAFMRLTEEERDFLHCLKGAAFVQNETGLRQLQGRVDPGLLADLSVARALMGISNAQTDLLGWRAIEDWQSAAYTCQRMLEFAALALLGAVGSTHPGSKWVTRLLRQHFDDREVPARLLNDHQTLAGRYHSSKVAPAPGESNWRFALECAHFTNFAALYAQTGHGLIEDPMLRAAYWSRPMPLPPEGRSIGPELALSVQIRCSDNRWYVFHVAGEMFEINEPAAAMLLLMDGRTTESEALAILQGEFAGSEAELQRSFHDMLLFLDNANMLER